MNEEPVTEKLDDGVLILTLNRPDRLNAWTYDLGDLYFDLLDPHIGTSPGFHRGHSMLCREAAAALYSNRYSHTS